MNTSNNITPTYDHVLSVPGSTFAFFWANHFFQELREAYLKAKLGGYSRYDIDLERLLTSAKYAMPEGSTEYEAFWKVDTLSIPDDNKKCPELAKQLNDLAVAIFGRNLVPSSKEITVDYLVREEYSLCPQFHTPAYQRWLVRELRKKAQGMKNGNKSPLDAYILDVARKLCNIVNNESLAVHEEFMQLLMKLSALEQEIVETQEDNSHLADDEKNPLSPRELKEQCTLVYLLKVTFLYHLQGPARATALFELLKALDEYQPNTTA